LIAIFLPYFSPLQSGPCRGTEGGGRKECGIVSRAV
jgi:hypothetical protein